MSMTRTITTTTQLAGDAIGATTETKFDSVKIPAGKLEPGRHVKVRGSVVVDGVNGSDTMRVRCRLGADDLTGVVIADSGAVNVAQGEAITFEADLACVTEGPSGTFDCASETKATPSLFRPKSVTVTDDDSAATNGTAVYVCLAPGGGARFASNCAGTADSAFIAADYSDAWYVVHNATPGSLPTSEQVYFDEDGAAGAKLLHAGAGGFAGDFYVESTGGRLLKVAYSATAAADGVALYFDDDVPDSSLALLFVSPTDADGAATTDESKAAWAEDGTSTSVDGGAVDTGLDRYVVASLESSSANAGQTATLSSLSVEILPLR